MNKKQHWAWAAISGSAALLIGALLFQYVGGLAPCKMCIWQRWPHGIAIALGLVFVMTRHPAAALVAAVSMFVGAGIGMYHAGVEQGWWQGPSTCTAGPVDGQSASDLLDQILNTPLVRCDEIAWSMIGISMAGWNAIFSLGLALVWIRVARN